MQAQEAAKLFKLWAAENGFVSKERFAAPFDVEIDGEEVNAVPLGAAAVQIFHSRGINFIGFNETDRQVIVFTNRKLTRKQRAELPKEVGDGIAIIYRQGNVGSVVSPPGQPFGQGPYALHNGRYTCGSSIAPGNVFGAGTLGAIVRDAQQNLFGLSCNHVTGCCNFSEPGMPIIAPGHPDIRAGGVDPFTLGYHAGLLPMMDGIPQNVAIADNTDAALFAIRDPNSVSSQQRTHYDTPATTLQIAPGMLVQKVGRTTGRTAGIVRAQAIGPEPIQYQIGVIPGGVKVVYYQPIFVVEGTGGLFAEGGDSGSLVVTEAQGVLHAVGIVSGVHSQSGLCFVLPIGPILARMNVTLVHGLNV